MSLDSGSAAMENPVLPSPRTPSIGEAAWFAPALTAVYALVLSFGLLHHEIWRDEMQAWLLARDSADVVALFRNLKYEGHPGLWHLLLMPVTRLTNSPVGMQMLHLTIATATIFIVAKYAPFSMLQKSLFAFGYFPLYEYGVKSRNYALGLLCVVVTCVLLRRRWRHPLWLALVLVLMSHTSAHACIIAISVTFGLAVDYRLNRQALAADDAVDVRRMYAGFVVVFIGIVLSVLQMSPAADSGLWAGMGVGGASINRLMRSVQQAFFSPDFFVMTGAWAPLWGLKVGRLQQLYGVYACAFLATVVVCYRHRPVAQLVFLCCVTGFLHFFMLIHAGSPRHYGFLMIALLLLLWGGRSLTVWDNGAEEGFPRKGAGASFGGMLLTGLLGLHTWSGLNAVAADIERPFSLGKRAAEYIEAENLAALPMIGNHDSNVSVVVGYLQRKRTVHYVPGNREGTFIRWDLERKSVVDERMILSQTHALAARTGGTVLMILHRPLSLDPAAPHAIRSLASFTGAMGDGEENFYLYLYETSMDDDPVSG